MDKGPIRCGNCKRTIASRTAWFAHATARHGLGDRFNRLPLRTPIYYVGGMAPVFAAMGFNHANR